MFFKLILFGVVLLPNATAFAESPKPIIREERNIVIDGVEERWRLEWVSTPSPACAPPVEPGWMNCPCEGFAFGERGDLVLVRKKPGQKRNVSDSDRFLVRLLLKSEKQFYNDGMFRQRITLKVRRQVLLHVLRPARLFK